ncbi:MAG: GNAT family N-acetyltransferase [Rhodospirillaceae bacterium]|nr:GNAT family N-acetyltransferase [Rhodospirillaceae bacterium]
MQIRLGQAADLDAITDIYNQAVLTTTATFDTEPKTAAEQRRWFEAHTGRDRDRLGRLVTVVGAACVQRHRGDLAVRRDGISRPGRGHGAETGGHRRRSRAGVSRPHRADRRGADASRHLSERFGFSHAGTLREVGRKFGQTLDVHLYQLILD